MTVTLTQAKAQLRVRHNEHDTYITDLIARAKAWIERFTSKPIAVTEVTETFTEFGDYIPLTYGPVVDITSIGYVDADDEDQVVPDARLRDGRIYPPSIGWPSFKTYSTITVTYDAGFATTPPEIDQAMLLLIEHWYYPDNDTPMDETFDVPLAVVSTAGPFRTPTLR